MSSFLHPLRIQQTGLREQESGDLSLAYRNASLSEFQNAKRIAEARWSNQGSSLGPATQHP